MNDFEGLEKKLKDIGQKTTPDADRRILDDAFAAMGQVPRTGSSSSASTFISKVAAAVIIVLVILSLVFVFTRPAPPPEEFAGPSVITETEPGPPRVSVAAEPNTRHTAREETIEELRTELERIVMLAQAGDVNGLLVVLDEGSVPVKMLAANYLAQIGDLRVAQVIEDLAAELTPDDPNSVFALAAAQIKAKYREPLIQSESADGVSAGSEPESVQHGVSGWLINASGQPVNGMVQIGSEKVTADAEAGFTMPRPIRKEFMSSFGRAYDANGQMGCFFIWHGDEDVCDFEVIVKPFAAVVGNVVNSQAVAVNDFYIELKPYVTDETIYKSSIGEIPWRSIVRPDGTFEVNPIPVGIPLGLVVTKPGFKTQIRLDLTAGRTLDLNDVVLESLPGFHENIEWDCSLAGYILNENNEPLAGASVSAVVGEESFEAISDSFGWYEFENLPNSVATQIVPYFDGYGHNLFGYDRTECNSRLDIQIFPQAYDWYGRPAPPLLVRKWLNCEPFDIEILEGNVVLICFVGDYTRPGNRLYDIEELHDYYSEQGGLSIIMVNNYVEPNSPKEDGLLDVIEELEIGFPFAVDENADAAEEIMLPEYRSFEGNRISVKKSRTSSGATNSVYQVRQRPAYFLIDKNGILRASAAAEDLYESIDQLLAE